MAQSKDAVTQDTTLIKIGYFSSKIDIRRKTLPQIEELLKKHSLNILVLQARHPTADSPQIAGFQHHFAVGDPKCWNVVYIRDGTRCFVGNWTDLLPKRFSTETPLLPVIVSLNGLQRPRMLRRLLKQIELACSALGPKLPKGFVSIAGIETSHNKFSETFVEKMQRPPALPTNKLQFLSEPKAGLSHVISTEKETVIPVDNLFTIGSEKGYLTTCEIPVNANSPIAQRVAQPLHKDLSGSNGLPIEAWIHSRKNGTNHFICSVVCRFLKQPNLRRPKFPKEVRVWNCGFNRVGITVVIEPEEDCYAILTALKNAIQLLEHFKLFESTCTLFYTPTTECIWCPNTKQKKLDPVYESIMSAYPISVEDDLRIFQTEQAKINYYRGKPENQLISCETNGCGTWFEHTQNYRQHRSELHGEIFEKCKYKKCVALLLEDCRSEHETWHESIRK